MTPAGPAGPEGPGGPGGPAGPGTGCAGRPLGPRLTLQAGYIASCYSKTRETQSDELHRFLPRQMRDFKTRCEAAQSWAMAVNGVESCHELQDEIVPSSR